MTNCGHQSNLKPLKLVTRQILVDREFSIEIRSVVNLKINLKNFEFIN
jgi:hypothetical protein